MFGDGPEGQCHTKAAEVGPLASWAVCLLDTFALPGDAGTCLRQAGEALNKHMLIMKESPQQMPPEATRGLLATFHRHVQLCRAAP
eukprot:1535624-Pyramimonas_sp.AAC.1